MKLIKLCLILLILISLGNISTAQVVSRNYLPEDHVDDIKARTLIVEVLKEDPQYLAKLKKDGREEDIKSYKRQIAVYNGHMKRLVPDYWKLNKDIDYKDADGIKAIPVAETKNYSLLLFTDLDDASVTDAFVHEDILIPSLQYQRADKPYTKPDVKMPIPSSHVREMEAYEESDIIIALMLLQGEVNEIEKARLSNYKNFLKGEGDANCSLLKGKKLLLDEATALKEFNPEDARTDCSLSIKTVDGDKINDQIYNHLTEGQAVLVTMPASIIKPVPTKPGAPVTGKPEVVYAKMIVDLKTFKVLSIVWPSVLKSSEKLFNAADFKKLCRCPD